LEDTSCLNHYLLFTFTSFFQPRNASLIYVTKSYSRDLHAYLGEVSKRLDCPPIRVGGVEDHVHILSRFGRTITQAEWIKELKRVSNIWLKTEGGLRHFQWQAGYADFSVSASNLERVKRYIENQKQHHRRMGIPGRSA
jgi:REP element-mobilizing transposase RayT